MFSLPGCECPALYKGPHCEYLKSDSDDDATVSGIKAGKGKDNGLSPGAIAIVILVVCMSSAFIAFVARKESARRQKKREVVINLQEFRDENFGAMSANGNMLFPSASRVKRF
jgi:hypothetical protein